MVSLNRATILGNVGKDPDIRTTQSGDKIAAFPLATSESWTDKRSGERVEKTQWHSVVFEQRLVEIVDKYISKGSRVLVEGAVETRKWTDQRGDDRYTTEIVVRGFGGKILLLGDQRRGEQPDAPAPGGARADLDDEIPF
jgi:single-strand DNA-binding protein